MFQSIIYYAIRSPKLLNWLQSVAIEEALEHTLDRQFVDLDPVFNHNLDDDYDFRAAGITRASFWNVYGEWIQFCCEKRRQQMQAALNEKNTPKKTVPAPAPTPAAAPTTTAPSAGLPMAPLQSSLASTSTSTGNAGAGSGSTTARVAFGEGVFTVKQEGQTQQSSKSEGESSANGGGGGPATSSGTSNGNGNGNGSANQQFFVSVSFPGFVVGK